MNKEPGFSFKIPKDNQKRIRFFQNIQNYKDFERENGNRNFFVKQWILCKKFGFSFWKYLWIFVVLGLVKFGIIDLETGKKWVIK